MDKDIIFRTATQKDLKSVIKVYENAIRTMESKGIYQWDSIYPNEEVLQNDIVKDQMLLGEIDGKIVSVFVLNQDYDKDYEEGNWQCKNASFFIVHRLCVNPDFQGKGIGKKTVLFIEDFLKHNEIESIRLDAFSLNPVSLKMYEGLGFKKTGEVYWRKGMFYLYEKKL
jgi:GNAT superfamily N-acetyltransferase